MKTVRFTVKFVYEVDADKQEYGKVLADGMQEDYAKRFSRVGVRENIRCVEEEVKEETEEDSL